MIEMRGEMYCTSLKRTKKNKKLLLSKRVVYFLFFTENQVHFTHNVFTCKILSKAQILC